MIRKTTDMKNQAIRSPVVLGIAGALLGTVAARLIRGATAKQRRERIEWRPAEGASHAARGDAHEDYEAYGADGPGLGERAADLAGDVKDKASTLAADAKHKAGELKDRAAEVVDGVAERARQGVHEVRERLPSADEIRGKAQDVYRFATDEQPALGGVLAMGIGMALGFLIPVTESEERAIRPLKDRAAENLGHLDDKVRQLADKLDEKLGGDQPEVEADEPQQSRFGATQSRPFPSA